MGVGEPLSLSLSLSLIL